MARRNWESAANGRSVDMSVRRILASTNAAPASDFLRHRVLIPIAGYRNQDDHIYVAPSGAQVWLVRWSDQG